METTITKAVPVVLPVSDWAAIKQQGRETGRSASAIVRDLVAAHLGRTDSANDRRQAS